MSAPPAADDSGLPDPLDKGNGMAEAEHTEPESRLVALPAELIAAILCYLPPADLVHVAETCRALYTHAVDDHLWQFHVQSNVPAQLITSPYPCSSFLELFRAHHPRWFLPRHKIWFSDTGLPGRIIVTRYDQRRGCIEGYQLVARNRDASHQRWEADHTTVILGFRPDVRLHLDSPVLRLPANSPNDPHKAEDPFTSFSPNHSGNDATGEASSTTQKWRFQTEIRMQLNLMNRLQSSFVHARALPHSDLATRRLTKFPYSHIWPPPTIPSTHHVLGAGLDRSTSLRPTDHATHISETNPLAFRIYKWIQIHDDDPGPSTAELLTPPPPSPSRLLAIGEEVSTYTTLAPELYTPTVSHPFRGIWVGDYGSHGCEFLWLRQPDSDPPQQRERLEGESDEAYAARMREPVFSGRLEGVKLTGDANVPRGEVTFVVEELGEGGVVGVGEHKPFEGVRIVRSRGHIADNGFSADTFIDSQMLLISTDRLAHYWPLLGHISYYQRVDIDQFLTPS